MPFFPTISEIKKLNKPKSTQAPIPQMGGMFGGGGAFPTPALKGIPAAPPPAPPPAPIPQMGGMFGGGVTPPITGSQYQVGKPPVGPSPVGIGSPKKVSIPQTGGFGGWGKPTAKKKKPANPKLSSYLNQLVEGVDTGSTAGLLPTMGDQPAVTIRYVPGTNMQTTAASLEKMGVTVANVGTDYIEAYIPVGALQTLSDPSMLAVREIIPSQANSLGFNQELGGSAPSLLGGGSSMPPIGAMFGGLLPTPTPTPAPQMGGMFGGGVTPPTPTPTPTPTVTPAGTQAGTQAVTPTVTPTPTLATAKEETFAQSPTAGLAEATEAAHQAAQKKQYSLQPTDEMLIMMEEALQAGPPGPEAEHTVPGGGKTPYGPVQEALEEAGGGEGTRWEAMAEAHRLEAADEEAARRRQPEVEEAELRRQAEAEAKALMEQPLFGMLPPPEAPPTLPPAVAAPAMQPAAFRKAWDSIQAGEPISPSAIIFDEEGMLTEESRLLLEEWALKSDPARAFDEELRTGGEERALAGLTGYIEPTEEGAERASTLARERMTLENEQVRKQQEFNDVIERAKLSGLLEWTGVEDGRPVSEQRKTLASKTHDLTAAMQRATVAISQAGMTGMTQELDPETGRPVEGAQRVETMAKKRQDAENALTEAEAAATTLGGLLAEAAITGEYERPAVLDAEGNVVTKAETKETIEAQRVELIRGLQDVQEELARQRIDIQYLELDEQKRAAEASEEVARAGLVDQRDAVADRITEQARAQGAQITSDEAIAQANIQLQRELRGTDVYEAQRGRELERELSGAERTSRRLLLTRQISADAAAQGRQITFQEAQAEAERVLERERLTATTGAEANQLFFQQQQLAEEERARKAQNALDLFKNVIANPFGVGALNLMGGMPGVMGGGGMPGMMGGGGMAGVPGGGLMAQAPYNGVPGGGMMGGGGPGGMNPVMDALASIGMQGGPQGLGFPSGLPTLGMLGQLPENIMPFLKAILGFSGQTPGSFGRLAGGITPGIQQQRAPTMLSGRGRAIRA
jgi:hypothetical protein